MEILTLAQALDDSRLCSKRHVLLGNGFSISCRPNIFVYGKLFDQANFSKLSPTAKKAFSALNTQDFEKVIKSLRDSHAIMSSYGLKDMELLRSLENDACGLRELLVETIANSHPTKPSEITDEEYANCRLFISNFDTVYTLNYDLLLYWSQMHVEKGENPTANDGFRKSQDDYQAPYVVWDSSQSHEQNTWFLHGALHVFDSGIEIQKYTWSNTGIRLIEQIREALSKNLFPLFVSEGTSAEKLERIRHSDYLSKGYRSFSAITGALFIYGHSLAESDEHYLKRIERGKITRVYIGIYGDPDSDSNKFVVRRANQLALNRRKGASLIVKFFDSSTASVWK